MNVLFWAAGVAAMAAAFSGGDLDEAIRLGTLAGPVAVETALASRERAIQLAAVAAAPAVEDRVELLPALARVAAARDRRVAIPAARAGLAIASELAGRERADDIAPGDLEVWRALFEALAFSDEHPIEVRILALDTCHALASAVQGRSPQVVPRHSGFGRFRSPRRAEREACGVSATGGNATEHNEAIGDGSAARTDQNHCGEVLGFDVEAAKRDRDPAIRAAVAEMLESR